jgi:hypothetical protein
MSKLKPVHSKVFAPCERSATAPRDATTIRPLHPTRKHPCMIPSRPREGECTHPLFCCTSCGGDHKAIDRGCLPTATSMPGASRRAIRTSHKRTTYGSLFGFHSSQPESTSVFIFLVLFGRGRTANGMRREQDLGVSQGGGNARAMQRIVIHIRRLDFTVPYSKCNPSKEPTQRVMDVYNCH